MMIHTLCNIYTHYYVWVILLDFFNGKKYFLVFDRHSNQQDISFLLNSILLNVSEICFVKCFMSGKVVLQTFLLYNCSWNLFKWLLSTYAIKKVLNHKSFEKKSLFIQVQIQLIKLYSQNIKKVNGASRTKCIF